MNFTHVLIVEDDDQLSRMYEKVLTHSGFQTLRATTADEAIDSVAQSDPDVVCLDWELRSGDALPFLDYLRTLKPTSRPRVIVISAEIDKDQLADYFDVVQGFMTKPITINDLVVSVRALGEDATQRLTLQAIQIKELAPGIVRLTWAGRINRVLIQETMRPELREARAVVFDVRKLSIDRLNIRDFNLDAHPPVPNLEYVFVVHKPDSRTDAQYLLDFLPSHVECYYYTKLDEAQEDAFRAVTGS